MCAIFTKMSLTIFIMLYIVSTVLSKDDIRKHFESECGPDNPMTPDYVPVTKNFKKVISEV